MGNHSFLAGENRARATGAWLAKQTSAQVKDVSFPGVGNWGIKVQGRFKAMVASRSGRDVRVLQSRVRSTVSHLFDDSR